jgi:hypothetical protein
MDFIFDGVALSDFGYVVAYDGLRSENTVVSNMTYNTIKPALYDISRKVSHNYDANLTTTFIIIKDPCIYNDNFYMTNDEISELTKWLVRKQYKYFRYIDDEDLTDEIWYKVQNTVDKVAEGDNVIGLSITVNANAPYGYTREIVDTWDDTTHDIIMHSDEEGYIYPDVTITVNVGGNLSIVNEYENRATVINNVVAGEVIQIFGNGINQIASSIADHELSQDFNYNFVRLCNQYGKYINTITTNLPCTITMKYRGIRKVGL